MKKKFINKLSLIAATLAIACTLTACGSSSDDAMLRNKSAGASAMAYDEYEAVATDLAFGFSEEAPASVQGNVDEKLIHTYYFSVQSLDFEKTMSAIKEKTTSLGGYIENSEVNEYDNESYAYLTLRIPQSSVNDFVELVEENGNIIHQQDNVDNQTANYIDYSARLKALDDELVRLEALANQTDNISELLEIENSLTSIRAQKDSIQGQLNYIDDKVNYATINIDLSEVKFYDNEKPSIWKEISERTGDRNSEIREMVVDYVSAIPYMLVGFILFLIPFTLVIFICVRIIRFCRRKRIIKKKEKSKKNDDTNNLEVSNETSTEVMIEENQASN